MEEIFLTGMADGTTEPRPAEEEIPIRQLDFEMVNEASWRPNGFASLPFGGDLSAVPQTLNHRLLQAAREKHWGMLRSYLQVLRLRYGDVHRPAIEHAVNASVQNQTLLMTCLKNRAGHEVIQNLVELGANVNAANDEGKTVLHVAVLNSFADDVRILLEHGADFAIHDKSGATTLHAACTRRLGSGPVVELLVSASGLEDLMAKDNDGFVPFWSAACTRNVSAMQALLQKFPTEQLSYRNEKRSGDNIGHQILRLSETAIAKILVESGIPINDINYRHQTLLHVAAAMGNYDVLESLRRQDADVDLLDQNERSALQIAIMSGHAEFVEHLFKVFPVSASRRTRDGETLAHLAAAGGHSEVLPILRKMGLSFSIPDRQGLLPLHTAAVQGHFSTVLFLLSLKVFVDSRTKDNLTALHLAAAHGKADVVDALLGKGADVNAQGGNDQVTPLHFACRLPTEKVSVYYLLMSGGDANASTLQGDTAMHYAAKSENLDALYLLLNEKADVTLANRSGETALHVAVASSNLKFCEALLHSTTEPTRLVNLKNNNGETPLHYACSVESFERVWSLGNVGIIRLLLLNGGSMTSRTRKDWETPLHCIAKSGNYAALLAGVEILPSAVLEQTIHLQTEKGFSPLMCAAEYGHTAIVELLLERKARTDTFDEEGRAALHLAAAHGHQETVRLLLLNQAFVNARTKAGLTPIHHAARHGHHEIVNMLVDHQAQDIISLHKKTALHYAAESGHVQVCRQLVELGSSLLAQDENGQTPLHLAAASDKPEVVAFLLSLPNSVELFFSTDWNGLNAAHVAAKCGSTDVVRQLLEVRLDLVVHSKVKGTDTTALHLAALNGHAEIVKVIVEAGGDPTVENKDGLNCLHLAARGGHWKVAEELENFVSLTISSLKTGLAALHVAAFYGQRPFMQEILALIPPNPLSKQPTVTNSLVRDTGTEAGMTPLHLTCRAGKTDVIRLLLTYAETNPDAVSDKTGTAPIHLAAKNGSIETVTMLLGRADLSVQDFKGRTALMFATLAGNIEFCRLLLDNGGDANIQDQLGWTALHYAASAGQLEILELLMAHGAQADTQNLAGKIPLQLAASSKRMDALKYLLSQPYDSVQLAEDHKFLFDLMICSKEARQRPLEMFISHSVSPVESALMLATFYGTTALSDREYEHDLHHAGLFCNALAHDFLQIACRIYHPISIFRSTARSGTSLAEFVVDGEHPHVVALPAFQRFLTAVWYGFEPWMTWNGYLFFFVCLLCPPLWLVFSIPAGFKYNHIPVVKFSCRVISHLYFMVLLVLVFMVPFIPLYERTDLTPRVEEGLLVFWIIGRAADETVVHDIRPTDRVLRVIIVAVCGLAFVLHICAIFTDSTVTKDLLFVRNELLAVGFFWCCAQLLRYLTLHPSFGSVEVLLRELGKDLMQFFGILIPFIFGCTLVVAALYLETEPPPPETHPAHAPRNRTKTHMVQSREAFNMLIFHQEPTEDENEEKWNILQIARKLYLSLFDRIKQPEFPRPKNGPSFALTLVDIFHMLYLQMAVIVILKILVATFTNTYKRIQSRSDFEWKYGRAKLILNTDHAYLTPAPFSVFLLPAFFQARSTLKKTAPLEEGGVTSQPGSVKSSAFGSSVGAASWRRSVLSVNRSAGSLQLGRHSHPGRTADVVNWKSVVDKFHQQHLLHRRPF